MVGSRSFGTFRGVFIPTFLSIIGVILYLRLGYVVGSAGLFGTLIIILLAVSITLATGLSVSSITTNIRIGAGGAYSIISKTLGLEVGGSVGIPLYLAQIFSTALYIFGFSEAWRFIFPDHARILVLLASFFLLFLLTYVNLKYAIHAQLIVFGLVLVSIGSIFLGGWQFTPTELQLPGQNFWPLFALFFPAVTGLMAGIGMSGELTDPKKQIPKGVLLGLGTTTIIYIALAFWFFYSSPSESLVKDNLIIVQLAKFSPLVLAGILGATFSSALTTFVAAPRLLNALGENLVLPYSKFLAKKSKKNEPRNATLVTAFALLLMLLLGTLDAIAPVLTVFFLITYAMINLVVFIEQNLGLVSFRPTFKIARFIPLYGFVMSILVMFFISMMAGLASVIFLILIYLYLVKRRIQPKDGDIRSGLLLAITDWAARKIGKLPESKKHTWKPHILFPVSTSKQLEESFPFLRSILYPNGTLSALRIMTKKEGEDISRLVDRFGKENIFTTFSEVKAKDYVRSICTSIQAVEGQFYHPNILFLPILPQKQMKRLMEAAQGTDAGIVFLDKGASLGEEENINVWLNSKVLKQDFYQDRDFDLAMLLAFRLHRNWAGRINLWMCVDGRRKKKALSYLKRLVYEARFPNSTTINVSTSSFENAVKKVSAGDINIIAGEIKPINLKKTFLYVRDSGQEDVLA